MEKILQHSIVKRGLIIAYYFSNRWYRKCLFNEVSITPLNNTDPEEGDGSADVSYPHKNKRNNNSNKGQENKEKPDWDDNVKNPSIPKKTD